MKFDTIRFAGEILPPELFVSPLIDRGIGTLDGLGAENPVIQRALLNTIDPELTVSDDVWFYDLEEDRTPDIERLVDRFEDVTGGVHPGKPTIKNLHTPSDANAEDIFGELPDSTAERLQRFYEITNTRPRLVTVQDAEASERSWGGDTDKLYARIRLPVKYSSMRALLHELGHCGMPKNGFVAETTTDLDIDEIQHSTHVEWNLVTSGLKYTADDGCKGTILEEAVAEGLGTSVNQKLGLVKNNRGHSLPDIVAPYVVGKVFAYAAPSAVALELIARQLKIPSGQYFRMFVDYANVGVYDVSAREEVAETIYKGTRKNLTLHQIEELPYPINPEASLALLWAVEDALDIPDHERYSDLFLRVLIVFGKYPHPYLLMVGEL